MNVMKVSKTIAPTQWMTAPETVKVMDILNTGSDTPKALFVGGSVRHVLTGEEVTDIDIATRHTPEQVQDLFKGTEVKIIPTGIDHGTVTAVINKRTFEITTLRKDIETDGRRAVVAYTDSWLEDANRRDFTMNTLLMDAAGNIYDPTGQGIDDLTAGKVIFVGTPAERIAEDYLRILRFFRFHALYGQGAPDATALSACTAAADKILTLSRERITQETVKILKSERFVSVLDLMAENSILNIFPDADRGILSPKQSLAAKLYTLNATEKYLIIPKALKREMKAITEVMALAPLTTDQTIKVALYKQGRDATRQAFLIQTTKNPTDQNIDEVLELINMWQIPTFPTTGEDLIAQGYKPGPELGRKLKQKEEQWIKAGF